LRGGIAGRFFSPPGRRDKPRILGSLEKSSFLKRGNNAHATNRTIKSRRGQFSRRLFVVFEQLFRHSKRRRRCAALIAKKYNSTLYVDKRDLMMTDIIASAERKRGSGVKMVYDLLRDEILDLVLPPGSPIDEVQLAERFKMSRTPIREALVRLSGEGLIDTLPNRSTMVSNIDFLNMHTYFDALVLMYRVTTQLAAQYHRPEDLAGIRAHNAEFAIAVEEQDALAMISTNAALHLSIAEAGRNPYFTSLFKRLLDEGRRILRLYYQSYDDRLPKRFVDDHEEMIAAIAARDIALSERLAREHAEQIVRQVQKLLVRNERLEINL
jgi:DNA-binding GntR family transcriptional regulator